ncbi:TrbI/VirB10 family protein [Paraburkholderia fungorum]|uniref:TrbI/VirB10 family protein n=2 Tax=Paraburkholderia fungorum TaxID=134537 RepID=UPI0011AE2E76|nr:TrbI/VirB10 family protein [Paraburkholderia fungorum]
MERRLQQQQKLPKLRPKMSEEIEEQDSPFEAANPSRRRVDPSDIPDSVQAPEREAVEDLTRGKRKKGKTLGFLLMLALLGGGLYYMYGMSDKPSSHRRKSQDTLTPSEMAGSTVVSGAKAAEAQVEQQRRQAAAAAAASAAAAKGLDPNAAAAAVIGAGGTGGAVGASGAAAPLSASQAAAAAAAAKQEADAKAAKEAEIAASPLQANDVQILRTEDAGRSSAPQSPADQLAQSLNDQMKTNQAAADRQMDRIMQMSTSYGGQGGSGGANPIASASRAAQQDQWLASQRNDDSAPTQMHAAPAMPVVSEGTPVRSVLLTGLDTDNPGRVKAMVTSDIYDTVTGRSLMIPKGSILTGDASHDVKVGQDRVLIAMTRLIRPDGSWIDLSGTTGDEMDGTSGLEGDVNNHFWKIFGSALVVGAATLLLDKSQTTVTLGQGLGTTQMGGTIFAQTLQQVVSDLLSRNQNIPPTITRSGGTQFIFLVRHDLALTPYYRSE